ncbi:MAG TPA: tetratricopeptide repeat protein, partial [Burkholderiales bacterium]|nr:tetratricopeptide repeat protein [Burkholderiales bacterium]
MQPAERFERMAQGPDEGVDVVRGALLIAAEQYPELDIEACVGVLDGFAGMLRKRLRPDIGPADALRALNRYMFEELGFHGATEDYYDPRNSFLNDVIARRTGIPITLAIVYMAIGRGIGLKLEGVSFPGHFLVRCPVHVGTAILDPYHRGISLGIPDLQKRLAPMQGKAPTPAEVAALLAPANAREILARLLRNLRGIYMHYRQLQQALAATSRILALSPGNAHEWRERAQLHLALECFRAALTDFQSYLALAPDAED